MSKQTLIYLDNNNHIHCSCEVVAENVGLSPNGVRQFCHRNEIPIDKGKINFYQYMKVRRAKNVKDDNNLSDSARKLKAEADLKTSKAKQAEMMTLKMMGELIPCEEVEEKLKETFLDIRQQLLRLPELAKVAVYEVDPAIAVDVEKEVKEQVVKLLSRLARCDFARSEGSLGEESKGNHTERNTSIPTTTNTDGE